MRYALRTIRKNPAFAAVTILTLALGIGANTAMFSVIYAVLLRPLPYLDVPRLALLFQTGPQDSRQPLLLPDTRFLRLTSRSLWDLAVYYKNTGFARVTLTGVPEPETVQGGYVSANFFPLLGVAPAAGRWFTHGEEARQDRVVLLSGRLWKQRFGASRDLAGRTLEIDGVPFRVIGVMPDEFQFPAREVRFWAPITTNRYWSNHPARGTNGRGFYARWNAVARLKPGISFEQARAEMAILARELEQRDPELDKGFSLTAIPLQVEVSGNTRLALWLLLASVSLVLLISCGNAAHLMLARAAARGREMAVRMALGAGRSRLVRQLLAESLVLAIAAGALGLLLAALGVRGLVAYGPRNLPRLEQAGLDTAALAFTLAISFLSAVFFGVVPAWKASGVNPDRALRAGGRGGSGTLAARRTRGVLVALEFAFTVMLLAGGGLMLRSFLAVQAIDSGMDAEHVLTLRVVLPAEVRHAGLYDQSIERIRTIPGVRAAGAINGVIELGETTPSGDWPDDGKLRVWANWKTVRGDGLEAMGIPLVAGRPFGPQDGPDAPLVAITDQTMARRYWPGQDPIGKQFRGHDPRGRNDDPLTVVGVIRDTRARGRESDLAPHVYQPAAQTDTVTPDLVIRTSGDPLKLAAAVRDVVRSLDRAAVVSGIATVEQQLAGEIAPRRFQAWLLGLFSLVALALAAVGIYGVMHYTVAQQRHDMGIRIALGARRANLLAMVLGQALRLAVPGLLIGVAGAQWLSRLFAGILFGVKPTDPATYLGAATLLMAVGIAAAALPAWNASRVAPLEALREE